MYTLHACIYGRKMANRDSASMRIFLSTQCSTRVQMLRLALTIEAASFKIFPGAACWEAAALLVSEDLGSRELKETWLSYNLDAGARSSTHRS